MREMVPILPPDGAFTMLVARHEAPTWPSPEVNDFAAQRSRLLHTLETIDDVEVTSWGETDGQYPREVVEIIVAVAALVGATAGLITALAPIIVSWVKKPNEHTTQGAIRDAVAGVRIVNHRGEEIEWTYRDPGSEKKAVDIVQQFLRR